jgi:hypothetical protein
MVELDDSSLLVTSYAWMLIPPEGMDHRLADRGTRTSIWPFTFLGGYLLHSKDGGHTWSDPILPPQLPDQGQLYPGISVPAWNRGAMCQGTDGQLYWAVACWSKDSPDQTGLELLVSSDRGTTWTHRSRIARDSCVTFNETSLIETARGDLVGFVRTAGFNDRGVLVRSRDRGWSWDPWEDLGIVGHPYHATRLPDGRFVLVYGYRHPPYGIRARVLDPECTSTESQEIVLRADGGTGDLGYPWACVTAAGGLLVVYYMNVSDGTRHIAGTLLQL